MTEETFAEKFPSLEKEINTPEPCDDSWTLNDCYDAWMMAVEKHCLDKQKVKDAIDNYINKIFKKNIDIVVYNKDTNECYPWLNLLKELKYELGLDK